MRLTFIHEKNPIADDRYIVRLKASRKQQRAILAYYPSQSIALPISWVGESQGFSFIQFVNKDFSIPLPSIQAEDIFAMNQYQIELTALTQEIEMLVRAFMQNSPITSYSDRKLVVVRLERTKPAKKCFQLLLLQ